MADLKRVVNMNGVERTLTLDMNATIAIEESTGRGFFDLMMEVSHFHLYKVTNEDILAGKTLCGTPGNETCGINVSQAHKMRLCSRLIWALSVTECPEFEGNFDTVRQVRGWFDDTDLMDIMSAVTDLIAENISRRVSKSKPEFVGQLAPFVATPESVVARMIWAAGDLKGKRACDLGAGDGRLMFAALEAGAAFVSGCEMQQDRYRALASHINEHRRRKSLEILNVDLRKANLENMDAVFVYLLPGSNEEIKEKLFSELKEGAVIVSHDFMFAGYQPNETTRVIDSTGKAHHVYSYTVSHSEKPIYPEEVSEALATIRELTPEEQERIRVEIATLST